MQNRKMVLLVAGVVALIAVTAGASAYVTKDVMTPEKTAAVSHKSQKEQISWNKQQQPQRVQQQPAAQPCNDSNIVGTGIGAVAGGLVGHQFGGGKGKDLATIGGVIAGGAAGHEYIPTHNTLCR